MSLRRTFLLLAASLLAPALALGDCSAPIPLTCGRLNGTTAAGPADFVTYACGAGDYDGSEAVYLIDLPAPQALTITVASLAGGDLDLMLLRDGCDPAGCVGGGGRDSISLPVLGTGRYFLIVDGRTPADDGPFTLDVACSAVTQPIACGQTVSGSLGGVSRIDDYACFGSGYSAQEALYTFTLAAPQTVVFRLAQPTPFDLFLVDQGGLEPNRSGCLRQGDTEVASLNLPAGRYAVIVDGIFGVTGSYDLTMDCTLTPPLVDIDCGQSLIPGDNTGPSLIDTYGCRAGAFGRGEAYWRYRPTAGPLTVTATSSQGGTFDVFAFRSAEAPANCLGAGGTAVTLHNVTPGDYLFVQDSNTFTGATALSLACNPFTPLPIACGASVAGTTSALGTVNGYTCMTRSLNGGEAFLLLRNPIRQSFAVALSGVPAGSDLDLAIFDGPFSSTAPACRAGGDRVARMTDAPPGDYVIVVDGAAAATSVPFTVTATCGPGTLDCAGAPDLNCTELTTGDTGTAANSAFLYGDLDAVYDGGERTYRFVNPVLQSVNFLLRNPSDPRLDLILIRDCDPDDVVDWGDDALIEAALDPGTYTVIVDGREGISGTFELVTFCGGPVLEPPVLTVDVAPGECGGETKRLFFPTAVASGDVVFSFDLSGSMGAELDQVKVNARDIYSSLTLLIPSLRFGLASLVEYAQPYIDTVCGVNHVPTAPSPWHYRLHQPLTSDINQVNTVLQTINLVGGAKETYTRTFYESYTDGNIGWRPCARKLWLNFADEEAVDCNVRACTGGARNNGRDPGPDMITGTADDLELLPVLDAMGAAGINLIHVDSSENAAQIANWDCLAQRTGGQIFVTDRNGNIAGGTDIVRGLTDVIKDTLRACPRVTLTPTGPYASWVTVTPGEYAPVQTPFYGEFAVSFCVPPGTPVGDYPIRIEANCEGAGACGFQLLGTQALHVLVPEPCPTQPAAAATAAPWVCAGAGARLDGSSSTPCSATGLRYRWRDDVGGIICDWSPVATCDVVPDRLTTYTLEVRCVGSESCADSTTVTVDVQAPVATPAASAPLVCRGATVDLDGSASTACPSSGLLYRWLEGATPVSGCDWSPSPLCSVVPAGDTSYRLEVSCPGAPTPCVNAASVPVSVYQGIAAAGADPDVCRDDPVLLDGSGSTTGGCPGGPLYEWRQGATVVRGASPDPTWAPPTDTVGTTTYTLVVLCPGLGGCPAPDEVAVTVRECLAVHYGTFAARWLDGGGRRQVEVTWRTLEEDGSNLFALERAAAAAGPWRFTGLVAEATGTGSDYRLLDPDAATDGASPWYRIVEYTENGRGDVSPAFAAANPPAAGRAVNGRARRGLIRRGP